MTTPGDHYVGLDDYSPRRSRRETAFRAATVLAAALAGFVSLFCFGIVLITASVAGGFIDENVHSHAFAPGYWDSGDGSNWVRLDADGTGSAYVDFDSGFPDLCSTWSGPLTYEFTPGDNGTYGTLTLDDPDDTPAVDCPMGYMGVGGAGWWGGGYDWNTLCIYAADPDVCDAFLVRRDA